MSRTAFLAGSPEAAKLYLMPENLVCLRQSSPPETAVRRVSALITRGFPQGWLPGSNSRVFWSARDCSGLLACCREFSRNPPEMLAIRAFSWRAENRGGPQTARPLQTRHCSRPCRKMSFGKSMPMNTILLVFFSPSAQASPRSLPMSWCTPWKITLRSVPSMFSTPL